MTHLVAGLGFDLAVVRRVAPAAFAAIIGIVVACGLLAAVVAATTSTSLLDAHLATTPGGINAVLVTAFAAGANTSLVFGLQGLRLFVMVLAAPAPVCPVPGLMEAPKRRAGASCGSPEEVPGRAA